MLCTYPCVASLWATLLAALLSIDLTGSVSHAHAQEGGGWCYNEADCLARSKTDIGSSAHWHPAGVVPMDGGANGVLSSDPDENPDFHNWTKFHLQYCDGASYAGSSSTTVGASTLHFRGAAILDAFIDALLAIGGLAQGGSLIVGGTSAGGLATYLHLDHYRERMPPSVHVVGMPVSAACCMLLGGAPSLLCPLLVSCIILTLLWYAMVHHVLAPNDSRHRTLASSSISTRTQVCPSTRTRCGTSQKCRTSLGI